MRYRVAMRRYRRSVAATASAEDLVAEEVFAALCVDHDFARRLFGARPDGRDRP
jgi:hypothetical protein